MSEQQDTIAVGELQLKWSGWLTTGGTPRIYGMWRAFQMMGGDGPRGERRRLIDVPKIDHKDCAASDGRDRYVGKTPYLSAPNDDAKIAALAALQAFLNVG